MSDDQNKATAPFAGALGANERVAARHVHAACDALNDEGKKPTFEAIRALLGKGSYSTINEHLRTWVPRHLDFAPPLPDRLIDAGQAFANEFWREAILCATSQLVAERQNAKERLDEAHGVISALEAQIEAGEAKLVEVRAQLEQAIGKLKTLQQQNTEVREKLNLSEGELRAVRPLLQRLQLMPEPGRATGTATGKG